MANFFEPKLHSLDECAIWTLTTIKPFIEGLIMQLDRRAVVVVVLDPRKQYAAGATREAVLAKGLYGEKDQSTWPSPFEAFALSKAELCWRTGKSSRVVGESAPYLLSPYDVKYGGGVICDGLIVATSGLPQEFDEAVSHAVIGLFWAQARIARNRVMEDSSIHAIPAQ